MVPLPLYRLPVFGDAGDGIRADYRCSGQRLVLRRPRLGARERPAADGQVGLDRTADQAALQERVAAGWCETQSLAVKPVCKGQNSYLARGRW